MHFLLIMLSLSLALGGCLFCTALLRIVHSLHSRRVVQMVGLFIPAVALVLLSVLMAHFLVQVCFWTAPPADVAISEFIILVGAVGICIAIVLNLARAALLPVQMHRRTWEAPARLRAKVRDLAVSTGLRNRTGVRVCADIRPWALATGLVHPQLVLSSGLVALLDEEELRAVLCHELMHIRRGDLWWTVLCGVLRDLTWFVPATRRLYAQMLIEQELACDDQVVGEPRRLALASALVRVWQSGIGINHAPHGSLAFLSPQEPRTPGDGIEVRVRRLLENPGHMVSSVPCKALLVAGVLLALFVLAQVATAAVVMGAMGCNIHGMMLR